MFWLLDEFYYACFSTNLVIIKEEENLVDGMVSLNWITSNMFI